ncbi:mitochondrial carrier protein [Oryctes borbonicus]|uniref:Mitochondrial thiamine pyrophosphate carrier n=1 Tax=Oryctes borbonicus TaxID=1629725 RepID=A0A0T6AUE5_9SCAR|nr:mitochondrial carrier protein [Oryctes borbonicus]
MVNESTRREKISQSDYAVAGAVSGFVTRAVCQPLDVLKIRLQLQVEPISQTSISKYRSILQACILIRNEEGIRSFWKGHVPAQLLSIVYGGVQFWSFETLCRKANTFNLAKSYTPLVNFSSGFVAGSLATLLSFPFDVIRTRLVAQSEKYKAYNGIINAFVKIYKSEGFPVYFRGLTPTIIQVAPHAGIQFMCYKIFAQFYKYVFTIDENEYTTVGSILSGSLAGLCAKTVIYPLDLTRKRMQIQGFEETRKHFGRIFSCKGMVDCIQKIYVVEGFLGLFKGLSPSLAKAVATSALHFASYEYICLLLADRH